MVEINSDKAVFLDRDGVINRSITKSGKPVAPQNLSELFILPGVVKSIKAMHEANLTTIVVTNQPDVAKGIMSIDQVYEINHMISQATGITHFYICTHDEEENCSCRKPKPGLILDSSQELGVNPSGSYLIGDRWRDIEAGQEVGCQCFFIDYSYKEKRPRKPFTRVESLLEATEHILKDLGRKNG